MAPEAAAGVAYSGPWRHKRRCGRAFAASRKRVASNLGPDVTVCFGDLSTVEELRNGTADADVVVLASEIPDAEGTGSLGQGMEVIGHAGAGWTSSVSSVRPNWPSRVSTIPATAWS